MKQGYGEYLRRHRIASGYKSQRELAKVSGISSTTLSRIENEVQLPAIDTLRILAKYLKSTSFTELMVVCGYWSEEELLSQEMLENPVQKENAKEFVQQIKQIDLSDEDLLAKYNFKIGGRSLTEKEIKMFIAYVRSLWNEN